MVRTKQVEIKQFYLRTSFGTFWARRLAAPARSLALLCLLLSLSRVSIATAQPQAKNVLVVFSTFERDRRPLELIESSVRSRFPGQVDFSVSYLDYQHLGDTAYRESLAETFRHEFRDRRPDVIVAASIQAIQFVMQYRDKMFPNVPIVFFGVSSGELAEQKISPESTGITVTPALRGTIDLALRLNPDTNAVAVITDTGTTENQMLGLAHSELFRRRDKVKVIDVIGAPSPEMLQKIAALPPHTVALFQLAPANSTEPTIGAYDVLTFTAQHMPTYSAWDTICLNYGCIGGAYRDWQKDDQLAGDMAGRILNGERPQDIPVVDKSSYRVYVDWRALQHWHIPMSALPPDTVILNRPPTMWEQYKKYFIVTIVVISVLLLLVVGLLWERARKRKAEIFLRESEKRFRVMADTTPSLVWMCDTKGKITYLNDRWTTFTGSDTGAEHENMWLTYAHLDDLRNMSDILIEALDTQKSFSREYRLRRHDGEYRWVFDVASPRVNGDESFAGFIGSAIDITDQKQAQQALENVSGQLIEAQEKERTRIARDLHDDICQRLVLLSMELEQTERNTEKSPSDTKQRLEEIRKHCSEIAGDVQSLSHQLHSSKLEYLGVATAIRGFCQELSKQHGVAIHFTENNVPRHCPKDISLGLFRVAQEALHNAVKYSGVSEFAVELTATDDEARLTVSDSGAGFDVEQAKRNRGLGLVSMQERVHLIGGSLLVESKPGEGTRIFVVVPLIAKTNATSAERSVEDTARMVRVTIS